MNQIRVNVAVTGAASLAVAVWLAASAMAQTPPAQPSPSPSMPAQTVASTALVAEVMRDGSCDGKKALSDLRGRIVTTEASSMDVGRALGQLVLSEEVCAPIRAAAAVLQEAYPTPLGAPVETVATAATPLMDEATEQRLLAEAMKFTVGPPPRLKTKARQSGPRQSGG